MRDTVFHFTERLKILGQLKRQEISVIDVPDEYKHDAQLIEFERKNGLRITERKGFDIVSNSFFVEETLVYKNKAGEECYKPVSTYFDDFNSYYTFLSGDIYTNALQWSD